MIIAAMVAFAIVLAALGPLLSRRARGRSSSEPPSQGGGTNEWLDPEELLFSIPTLSQGLLTEQIRIDRALPEEKVSTLGILRKG